MFPDAEICIGSNDDEPFNRAAARNDAYRQATKDVFLVADADTIANKKTILDGIGAVLRHNRWVIPYQYYYALTELASDIVKSQLDEDIAQDIQKPRIRNGTEFYLKGWAGNLILTREMWEKVRGYDEGFIGWGMEDTAFKHAMDVMNGTHIRTMGSVLHLWHPAPVETTWEQPWIQNNEQRLNGYACQHSPENLERYMLSIGR